MEELTAPDVEVNGSSPSVDGRRARRQRSRNAIVAATFELILDGQGAPSAEDVAQRAGVSVSSIFRNFEGLADIQQQALELFTERYSHLLLATPRPLGVLRSRTASFVGQRLDLYEQAGPLLAAARLRSFENERARDHIGLIRSALAAQVRGSFQPEIEVRTPVDAANFVALVDSITSPEVFDLMTATHARTRPQMTRIWATAIQLITTTSPAVGAAAQSVASSDASNTVTRIESASAVKESP